MEKQNSYSHILKYTGLFGGVQGLNILVGVVRNKLVALILGPSGMGLLALFSSTIKLVGDSTNLGLSVSAIRELSSAYDDNDQHALLHRIDVFRHWSLFASMLGLLVCALLSPLLSRWTFSFGNHVLHFVLLSPVVGLTTFSAGELAILKATRRLHDVAMSLVCLAVASLAVAVPIYYFFGNSGIVPSLVALIVLQTFFVVRYSFRAYPFRLKFGIATFREGLGFIKLGIAFVFAGMACSGAEMGIRAYLSYAGDVDTVGLYNAAYVMIFTYAGMIFTAMETDYYPRLSSVKSLGREFNDVVNSQIEISLHIVSPLLILFILFMPVLLPLLYSGKFLSIVPMIQVAALSMYARSMYVPVEYISLSRGDSRRFFILELINAILLISMVLLGYMHCGLLGTGIGMAVASFVELIISVMFCRVCYGYKGISDIYRVVAVHLGLGLVTYATTFVGSLWAYCCIGFVAFCLDIAYSLTIVRKHVSLMDSIKRKFCGKLSKLKKRQ